MSDFPLAYLITFHTYGSWLHGDAKGCVDRRHAAAGTELAPADPRRLAATQARMRQQPFKLSTAGRRLVAEVLAEVCSHRGWELHAANVRTNHLHAVVAAALLPEPVMNALKSWATRRLREAKLVPTDRKVWSRHGSTRYLWDEQAVTNACDYVMHGQGPERYQKQ